LLQPSSTYKTIVRKVSNYKAFREIIIYPVPDSGQLAGNIFCALSFEKLSCMNVRSVLTSYVEKRNLKKYSFCEKTLDSCRSTLQYTCEGEGVPE
jgi:hypothetical protein